MANNFVLLPVGGNCIDYGCSTFEVCLPELIDCDGTPRDSLLVDCDEKWNCNLCATDEEYFVPYVEGDKIQIQTIFADLVSPDRKNPSETDWITVTLCNQSGEVTSDKSMFLSRWLFAWNGVTNYQIFEVDTAKVVANCWTLKIEANGVEVCTQDFQAVGNCGEEHVKIRGIFEEFDCNGFYYGTPDFSVGQGAPFEYDNTITLYAGLYPIPGTINKEKFASKVINAVIREQWRLVLTQKIPPFMDRLLMKTYLGGQMTVITTENGKSRSLEIISFAPRDVINYSNMMLYTADLFIECSEAVKRC